MIIIILKYFFFYLKGICSVLVNENESFFLKVNFCFCCWEKINKYSSWVIMCKCGNYFCWDCLRLVVDYKVGDICGKFLEEVYYICVKNIYKKCLFMCLKGEI